MSRWITVLLVCSLAGCAYMSRDRFDELYDKDGDGWGVDEDCNDENASIHPFAPDVRGDQCDADCGRELDSDGDDWPDDADCNPDDPDIFPCNPDEADGDGVDSDCDGQDGVRELDCNDAGDFAPELGLDPDFEPAETAESTVVQEPFGPDCLTTADDG